MAEDFHDALDVGGDENHIATVDADGVALAAIQGLSAALDETTDRVAELEAQLEGKDDRIDDLEARLDDLEDRLAAQASP